MKLIKAKQTFKSVSAKQAELFPALAAKVGTKRPVVEFELPSYAVADLAEFTPAQVATVVECLNTAVAQLAKDQFAANAGDWSWLPTVDGLSLEALAASFESVSRGRVLTLENAGKLATWMMTNKEALITGIQAIEPSYTATQFTAIVGVVSQYTKYEAKGSEFLAKIVMRLEQIAEALAGDDSLVEGFTADTVLTQVYDALVKKFNKSAEDEITEDAL